MFKNYFNAPINGADSHTAVATGNFLPSKNEKVIIAHSNRMLQLQGLKCNGFSLLNQIILIIYVHAGFIFTVILIFDKNFW